MPGLNDDERRQVLGEVLMDELKAIREYVQDIPAIKHDVQRLKTDVDEVRDDVKVIKAAVTAQSKQLAQHKLRLGDLEQAA